MRATEVLIEQESITINWNDTLMHVFTWEEFDDLEVAFDVVRRLSGAITDKKLLITIKDQKK